MPIPPWCVSRLAEALCDEQAENVVGSFRALGASAALNAAVAAAAGPVPGDDADDVSRFDKSELDAEGLPGGGRSRRANASAFGRRPGSAPGAWNASSARTECGTSTRRARPGARDETSGNF